VVKLFPFAVGSLSEAFATGFAFAIADGWSAVTTHTPEIGNS